VVSYIQEKHGAILSDSKDRIDYELQTINLKINKNLPEQIKVFSQKIHVRKTELKKVSNLLNEVIKNIKNIEGLNPILTATQLIDKKNLMDKILDLKLQILNEQKETNIIRDIEIKKSIRDKKQLESTLLPHNYQNSALVGGILIDDSPSKPRKKLILVAAFSAGLVISIFFVLLINAFRQENETAK
jgi:hypothetical protein